jgi:hypothetical protein
MAINAKNFRRARGARASGGLGDVADTIATLLPAGAQFGLVVLYPDGRGRFAGAGDADDPLALIAVMRQVLDAAEALERAGGPAE